MTPRIAEGEVVSTSHGGEGVDDWIGDLQGSAPRPFLTLVVEWSIPPGVDPLLGIAHLIEPMSKRVPLIRGIKMKCKVGAARNEDAERIRDDYLCLSILKKRKRIIWIDDMKEEVRVRMFHGDRIRTGFECRGERASPRS